jgi:hypothetical protein
MKDADPQALHQQFRERAVLMAQDIAAVAIAGVTDRKCTKRIHASYQHLRSASIGARGKIFSDPRTSVLLRELEVRILDCDGKIDPNLAEAISDVFSLLALSASVIDGAGFAAPGIYAQTGSPVLPGTLRRLSTLHETPLIDLVGTPNAEAPSSRNFACQEDIIQIGWLQLAIGEDYLNPADEYDISPTLPGNVDKSAWVAALENSVAAIRRHSGSRQITQLFGKVIVPIEATACDAHLSITFNSRPGVLYMSLPEDWRILAEAIVHESDHQWLYALGQTGSIWSSAVEPQPARYYSPWRNDPRPLDGLLWGASAFVRVGEFWTALTVETERGLVEADWCGARAALALTQALHAIRTISLYGQLASTGSQLLHSLETRAQNALNAMRRQPQHSSWFQSAQARIDGHVRDWIVRNDRSTPEIIAPNYVR